MATIRIVLPDPLSGGPRPVTFKFSSNLIHHSGLKSIDLALEACKYLGLHIGALNAALFSRSPEQHLAVLQWLCAASRQISPELAQGLQEGWIEQTAIPIVEPGPAPAGLDPVLLEIYRRPLPAMANWAQYANLLWSICQNISLFTGTWEIAEISRVNFVYNYSVGRNIDQFELAQRLNKYNGFRSDFVNSQRRSARAILDCLLCQRSREQVRGEPPKHTFTISAKGKIMQSSPCEEHAMLAYQEFLNALTELGFV